MVTLSVGAVLKQAMRSCKSWWMIPLCALALVTLLSESRLFWLFFNEQETAFAKPFLQAREQFKLDAGRLDPEASDAFRERVQAAVNDPLVVAGFKLFLHKAVKIVICLLLLLALLRVLMVLFSKAAVNQEDGAEGLKRALPRSGQMSLSYLLLAFMQVIPFFFCIFPGLLLYPKFYFGCFLITEQSANPFKALADSWKMTEGSYLQVCALFLIELVIDVVMAISVVGFIPALAFSFAMRAAAYEQLKGNLAPRPGV